MPAELVVASFNVHWGRGRKRAGFPPFDVVGACRRLAADVLVLQETWAPDEGPAQHDEVAAALDLQVAAVEPMARLSLEPEPSIAARGGDPAGGGAGTWNLAVLSRLPVRGTKVLPLPQLPVDPVRRVLLHAELDVGGSSLTVCGAHLPHLEFGAPLVARSLRAALPDPGGVAVLAGDMNMWGWTIRALAPAGWRRVVRGATFPAHRPLFQIDHLLVTDRVDAPHGEVVPVGASDHLAVRSVVRVP